MKRTVGDREQVDTFDAPADNVSLNMANIFIPPDEVADQVSSHLYNNRLHQWQIHIILELGTTQSKLSQLMII